MVLPFAEGGLPPVFCVATGGEAPFFKGSWQALAALPGIQLQSQTLRSAAMRYVVWALRLVVFIAVLMFALKNTGPVAVNFFGDYVVRDVPLIVVMLAVFVLGALFGLLLTVPGSLRRRREAARLRRENERLQAEAAALAGNAPQQPVAPETIAPMSPL